MSEVEEIKDRLSIIDLVGEYIRVSKAGSNWRALCPFHNEKTPSFMLSEERRSWHCFGCGKGGDIFSFVMEMEGIGFREALEMLAQKAGVEIKQRMVGSGERTDSKKRLFEILELSTKWYEKNLWDGKGKEKILAYLRERGINDESIKKFRLGYAPDGWRNMLEFLQKRDYKIEEIARTGLLVEKNKDENLPATHHQLPATNYYDRFRDRIMFPIQDIMGRVVGYSARVAPGGDEKSAKYINTPQTDLYDKSRVLYGLNFAKVEIKKRDEAVLVEGNMDVIASHMAGLPNAIAVSGTALTEEQIKAIKHYSDNLKMAFDMDSAGQAAAKKSARICLEHDLNVKIVLLPGSKDAADVIKEDPKAWADAVQNAQGVIEYFFEDTFSKFNAKNPAEKKKIARVLLSIVKDIADPVEKSHWLKLLAERLGVAEKILVEVISKIRTEKRTEPKNETGESEKSGKAQILEKRILGMLLAFPEDARRKIEILKPEDFSREAERNIYRAYLAGGDKLEFAGIKKKISDYEAQKFLDEAVFEVEVEAGERGRFDPGLEIGEAIFALKRRNLKEKALRLSGEIKQAEASRDKKRLSQLMEEFQEISEGLKE